MPKWKLEPGHTAAQFRVRHMMVTEVRGAFPKVRGEVVFDPSNPGASSASVTIDVKGIWSGDSDRDAHLRAADFLDVDNHPEITFRGNTVEALGSHDYVFTGDLTIRGVTLAVPLRVRYLGQWSTPFWEDGVDKGPKLRAGFVAEAEINRHDFGISWDGTLDKGGVVVGNKVFITIDAEAIFEGD